MAKNKSVVVMQRGNRILVLLNPSNKQLKRRKRKWTTFEGLGDSSEVKKLVESVGVETEQMSQ